LNPVVDVALERLSLFVDGFHDSYKAADVVVASPATVTVVACRRADVCRGCLVWRYQGPTSRKPPLDHGSPL
jgi:hypothetical protein